LARHDWPEIQVPHNAAIKFITYSVEERRLVQRERLIEAAVRVGGEDGYRNATAKAVCQAAVGFGLGRSKMLCPSMGID
jgi:hypothetical protein